ncbi:hypothetical protein, partial [Brucella abortus]|uniref:hypothetical protein n=1 Tax=Brucella abortus TaxID=235 RepID=UPI0027DB1351
PWHEISLPSFRMSASPFSAMHLPRLIILKPLQNKTGTYSVRSGFVFLDSGPEGIAHVDP